MDRPISSGLKITFLIHFIVALVFGLVFLIYPQLWGSLAGMQILAHELYRMLGAVMLALGVGSWLAYRAKIWESVRIIVLTEISWTAMAAVIILYYLIRHSFPALYWLPALLMAGFAVAFAYFYFKNR